MNPDFQDVQSFCICGEYLQDDEEFCSLDCQADFHEVQYQMHLELQYETFTA